MCYDNYNSINDFLRILKSCFVFFSKKVGFILQTCGIICEYNPLHLGHKKQIDLVHAQGGAVVCLMSGNFVQRGHPAIVDKTLRARSAMLSGADLVLELPLTRALSSAESFAAGGVEILSKLCDSICFGAETADADALMHTAALLLSPAFSQHLRTYLDQGLSFPAARAMALEAMGADKALVETPNNILAVEYCKAILDQDAALTPLPIHRPGSYHDLAPDPENPSATSLRRLMENGDAWQSYVPAETTSLLADAPLHSLEQGEKAILARLRTMSDADFEALPYGSEGLWRKLMHAAREKNTLEEIIAAVKSKRYTRTRIDRMILCAFLGLTQEDLAAPIPYCRVLAFNDTGRSILRNARESGFFVNIGEDTRHPYQALERRATALYSLFADAPRAPTEESSYRIYYHKA